MCSYTIYRAVSVLQCYTFIDSLQCLSSKLDLYFCSILYINFSCSLESMNLENVLYKSWISILSYNSRVNSNVLAQHSREFVLLQDHKLLYVLSLSLHALLSLQHVFSSSLYLLLSSQCNLDHVLLFIFAISSSIIRSRHIILSSVLISALFARRYTERRRQFAKSRLFSSVARRVTICSILLQNCQHCWKSYSKMQSLDLSIS